jgi:hypothetical protein
MTEREVCNHCEDERSLLLNKIATILEGKDAYIGIETLILTIFGVIESIRRISNEDALRVLKVVQKAINEEAKNLEKQNEQT